MRSDDRRCLVVGLDADQEARVSRRRAPAPQGPRPQRRLAPPGDEDDVARVSDPVARHVLRPRVGDDRLRGAAPEIVRPEVEGAVPTGREEDPGPVGREPRPQVEMRIPGQAALDPALEIQEVEVEVQVDVGGERDRPTVGRPAGLRVVSRSRRELARHAPLDGHQPDAALVREGDRGAVRRPGRIGRRGRHGRGEVAFHVHLARAGEAGHRGIASGKGARVVARLCRDGRGDEDEAGEERGRGVHARTSGRSGEGRGNSVPAPPVVARRWPSGGHAQSSSGPAGGGPCAPPTAPLSCQGRGDRRG